MHDQRSPISMSTEFSETEPSTNAREPSASGRDGHPQTVKLGRYHQSTSIVAQTVETFDAAAETCIPAHDLLSRGSATATLTAEVTRFRQMRLRKMRTNRGNPQAGADR
jgi:hypothetical protein